MKILLINPPFYKLYNDRHSFIQYPLSLGYLAAIIKKETNHQVLVYNAEFPTKIHRLKNKELTTTGFYNYLKNLNDPTANIWQQILTTIKKQKPDLIGLTCNSQNFKSALNIAKIAKDYNSKIHTVIGGPHPSLAGIESINNPYIDISIQGEGEKTIVELINALKNKKNLDSVKGICFKKNHKIIKNPPREFIADLDCLPFPHQYLSKTLINYSQHPLSAFKGIFATRGCPNNCMFCGSKNIWSRVTRYRTPKNVIKEIISLMKHGHKYIRFEDDTFGGMNQKYINTLCNLMIKKCPDIKWECEMNVSAVTDSTISIMKKAGCKLIQLGVESGNNQILKDIHKNITIEQAFSASQIIKKHKILLEVFFMVGFPQETEKSLNDTLNAINKINANFTVYSIFTPYPGTEIFSYCQNKHLVTDDFEISLYNHQSPLNCFCLHLSPSKFRELVSQIEKLIDKKNYSLKNNLQRFINKKF